MMECGDRGLKEGRDVVDAMVEDDAIAYDIHKAYGERQTMSKAPTTIGDALDTFANMVLILGVIVLAGHCQGKLTIPGFGLGPRPPAPEAADKDP